MTREKSDVGKRPYRGSIVISNLPNPKMAKLMEEFDLTGSGTVNFEEISYAAYLFRESKRHVKWGGIALGTMCFLLTLMVVTQCLFVFWVVDSHQFAETLDGKLVDVKSGKPLQVGSSVFDVSEGGVLQTKGGGANVGVHANYDQSTVSSNLSDEQLREMRRFDVRSSAGNYISMQVLSVARHSKANSKCGTVVVIYTFIGDMTIDGGQLTFNERVAGAFQNAGFAVDQSRRRLMGAIDLIGFFDMLVATTDYAQCPSTYNDMMVDGSWYTTTDIYKSCMSFSCLSTPYDYTEFPMIDTEQVWPTNDASLAVINGKAAAKDKTFGWSEGVVDVDGEKFFKYTEYAYGEGVDNVFTSIEMKNFPGQRINEVRNKTHLFSYNSWEDKNMFCNLDKDIALQIKKENQAKMNEKFNEVQVNSNFANADFSKTKEMVTIDGVVYNKWVYFNKMDNDGTLEQVMYESYSTGKPWKTELWMDGRLRSFSRYSFEVADGSSYGPSDLKMERDCVFDLKDRATYSDNYYMPFRAIKGMTKTVKPQADWLKPKPGQDGSRRRLQAGSDCGVGIPFPGGVTYTARDCPPNGCCVDFEVSNIAGFPITGSGTLTNDIFTGDISIGTLKLDRDGNPIESGNPLKKLLDAMNITPPLFGGNMKFRKRVMTQMIESAEGVKYVDTEEINTADGEGFLFVNTMVDVFGMRLGAWGIMTADMLFFDNGGQHLSAMVWLEVELCLLWADCITVGPKEIHLAKRELTFYGKEDPVYTADGYEFFG